MSRTASRTLVAALAAVFVLAAAEPAAAQKAKSRSSARKGTSSAQVKRVAPPRARSSVSARTIKAVQSRARSARTTRPSQARPTVRVNRAPAPSQRTRGNVKPSQRTTVRVNRAPAADQRTRNRVESVFTRNRTGSGVKGNNPTVGRSGQKERTSGLFTTPRNRNRDRPNVDNRRVRPPGAANRPARRAGYGAGYRRGYDRGYYRGYHDAYVRRHHYRHYHYYGLHRIWGFHFGGFGFYHGHWHFAIVIGSPVVVYRDYCGYYNYCWWNGRSASLVTWSSAVQAHPATYTFTDGSCVELWIRTTEGDDYAIKVDPRYWNARDPGDLYAALWAELDQEGQLQIEDINGALHVFPAGMIQQIEARACR